MTTPDPADVVVLVDDRGQPTGTAPRAEVHTADTPLHLAFSCYLFDDEGRVLVTRRALTKRTWPGVWTNSFCGHPRPGESFREAVERYADHELGVRVFALSSLLPDFRYRAVDASGVVENKICPVRSEEHTSELQSRENLVCRLLLEKKQQNGYTRSSDA